MGQGVVEIHPRELQFTFELKKQSSCSVHLLNKSDEYVAFKVKTTSPKRYCVRPNTGVILPRATCDFTVTMQAQRTAPPDMQLKDKFLVQTTVVPPGTSDEDLIPAFFSKETNGYIEESKLRVVLVSASHPPVEQLLNGVHNTDAAVEVPVLKDTLNAKNEVPAMEKDASPPMEQISAIVTGIPSPVKETPILTDIPSPVKETSILTDIPSPVKETSILTDIPSPVKETSILTDIPSPVKETSILTDIPSPFKETPLTDIPSPVKKTPVLTDITSPVKETPILREVPVLPHEEPAILTESPPPLKDTPAINIEQLPPPKEKTAILKESPLEETVPKEAVTLSDRGLFSVQNHQLSHVTEDVQNLKSKLNNLESKLEEAEKMIIKLREESRTTTQERDKLQQDMVFLRKKGTPKSQVGFPMLFVVYVALLGTSLGYLLRL